MAFDELLFPAALHGMPLRNRIVMAPMTRCRADASGVPLPSVAVYYKQRAEAGLIVSEAIAISRDGTGSPRIPGLYTNDQIAAWKTVTDTVHAAGGTIFAQLFHAGRVGHSAVRNGRLPVAPSPIAIVGQQHFTGQGMENYETPLEMSEADIKATIADYRMAAANARTAGFDGVELHAAFGYLPNQFLSDSSNRRMDSYGGNVMKRCRFVMEVMSALIGELGTERTGIRLSPSVPYNNMTDSNPQRLYSVLLGELNTLMPGYVHLMNALFPLDDFPTWPRDVLKTYRPLTRSPVIANGGYTPAAANSLLKEGGADLVSFGSLFIANPDLPARLARNAPLATPDPETFYTDGDAGYIDYPMLPA